MRSSPVAKGASRTELFSAWLQRALANTDKPAWRTFIVSLVALALAFLLAMYSTIFAQQGRVIATGLCALSALALAAYVGFTAIPYLARRTQIEWLQVSLDYRLTNEGWAFILLILLLGVAGLNTGNNLLYMILSTLLAALLMSGMLSLAVLNGVAIELEIPLHVFARRPVEAVVILENLKKFFPSFSLTLQGVAEGNQAVTGKEGHSPLRVVWTRAIALGVIGGVLAAMTWILLWKLTSDFFGLRLRSLVAIAVICLVGFILMAFVVLSARERQRRKMAFELGKTASRAKEPVKRAILNQPVYFPFLARGGTIRRRVELEFPRRGHYREKGLNLSTRFPFGFLEKTMHVGISHDLLVYPATKPSEYFFKVLPMITGEVESFQKGFGHDLYSLREMAGSDSVRHVDWKASARTGSLMVREFAREDDRRVQLVLDKRIGAAQGMPAVTASQFEAAVEFCACLTWHFHETGTLFQFVCADYRTPVAPASDIVYDVLGYLAEVEASDEAAASPFSVIDEEGVFRIVCTPMTPEMVPPAEKMRAHFIYFSELASSS